MTYRLTSRWRWRGGNGEVKTGEQGEAAKLEDSEGRQRLLGKRRLEGKARLLGWRRRLVQGEFVKLEEAVDGEERWCGGDTQVKMASWKKSQNNV